MEEEGTSKPVEESKDEPKPAEDAKMEESKELEPAAEDPKPSDHAPPAPVDGEPTEEASE